MELTVFLSLILIISAIVWIIFIDSANRIDPKNGKKLTRKEVFNIPQDDDDYKNELNKENKEKLDPDRYSVKIAKIVKKEIDDQKYEEVTWLRAFKKAKGNKEEAQALYAEYRAEELERIYYKKENKEEKKLSKIASHKDSYSSEENKFLAGRESLATAFWLYFFLGNLVIGIIVGALSVFVGIWITVFLLGYLLFSSVGLWKTADKYTQDKLRKKETYNWAIAARVYVVLNIVVVLMQTILSIGK